MKTLLTIAGLTVMLAGQAATTPVVVVRAARIFATGSGTIESPGIVVVRGDRITAAGPAASIPADARVIDLGNATLLPGLIDLHTHLTSTGIPW
jgi:imidazolonepropionase-like amidohydrolase